MTIQKSKFIVSLIIGLMQAFFFIWFIFRGGLGIGLLLLHWSETFEPAKEFVRMIFQIIWLGALPVVLLHRIRFFLLHLLDGNFFTEKNYQISKQVFGLYSILLLCHLLDDIFVSYLPIDGLENFALNYLFPYLDKGILLLVFACMLLIQKNGTVLKEEVDGFI